MIVKNAGGPAFPRAACMGTGKADEYVQCEEQDGMSLLDYFAAKAMGGLCSTGTGWARADDGPEIARRAYAIADAMLTERQKAEGR